MYPKSIVIPVVPAAERFSTSDCQSAEPYALMVLGDSMQPEFNDGEIIVIEPDGLCKDGSFVIADDVAGEPIFRQLRQTADGWQLQALNPAYPVVPLASLSAVKGVVLMKKSPGKPRAKKYYA